MWFSKKTFEVILTSKADSYLFQRRITASLKTSTASTFSTIFQTLQKHHEALSHSGSLTKAAKPAFKLALIFSLPSK